MTSWLMPLTPAEDVSGASLQDKIRDLIARVVPLDAVEDEHRRQALAWLDSTDDVFRRIKPRTPSPHLVSYFLLIDHDGDGVLLADHLKAGLWLPSGGHVEPGEHPVSAVRREAREELGIDAVFSPVTGESPLFVTVTETAPVADRHTDVSLWFVLSCGRDQPLVPDRREFREVRWWTRADIARDDPALFGPHLSRALAKFGKAG